MSIIKILGAGISGLSAAINLAKAGKSVEVYERNSDCGMRFHGDMQGLENWSKDQDVLDSLLEMNIEINFKTTPFRKVTFTNCADSSDFYWERPLFYLIQRGSFPGSLDFGLKEQAIKAGVKIRFNQVLEPGKANIVASGPFNKKIAVADKGLLFKTDLPNLAVGIINEQAANKGYSYLLVADGTTCLCACVFNEIEKLADNFEFTKKYAVKKYKLKIHNPKNVGGIGYFSIDNIYKKGKALFVGEAAGIQDFLAGFGMRTAFRSGYLAAHSIINKSDYEEMANKEFRRYIEAGIVNRYIWEHVDFDNYIATLDKVNQHSHSTGVLKSMYNLNILEAIEYPLALNYIKGQYPEIL